MRRIIRTRSSDGTFLIGSCLTTKGMLNGNQSITAREHRLFFAVTSVPLLVRLLELACALAFPEQPKPGISFAIYDIFDMWELMSPLYCFAAFVFIAPLTFKIESVNLVFSLFLLSLLTFFYDYWFVDSQMRVRRILEVNPNYEFKMLDFAIIRGSIYDVITIILVNALLIWHLSLLYRLWSSNRQLPLS